MKKMAALLIGITGLGMAPLFFMGWAGALSLSGCSMPFSTSGPRKEEAKEAYIHSRIWLEKLDDVPTATPATLPEALAQIVTLKTICTRQLAQLQRMNAEFASMYEINCGMAARQHTDALLEGKTTTPTTPATQSAQPTTPAAAPATAKGAK